MSRRVSGACEVQVLALASLLTAISAYGQTSQFAIGIPASPLPLYSNRTYSGPLGTEVAISAARNETEPFQLVLLPTSGPMSNVRITASALTGPGTIAAENVEIAPMGWQWMPDQSKWLATMLRPDITTFNVASDVQQPVWVNVYTPRGTPPGEYHGTLTINADGMQPQEVGVTLTVHPFTLPKTPTMKTGGASSTADNYLALMTSRRTNPYRLYMGAPISYDRMKALSDSGGANFNLLWLGHAYYRESSLWEIGPNGQHQPTAKALKNVFQVLDPVINEIKEKDPDFLKQLSVFGFDEPPYERKQIELLENWGRALKERYGSDLRFSFATYDRQWMSEVQTLEHIDEWFIVPWFTTADVDQLHDAGKDVTVYQGVASHLNPTATRAQFWGYFKDDIDGMAYYNIKYAGEGTGEAAASNPWGSTLFPSTPRTDGGLIRWGPDAVPFSTLAFEFWREGLEDVEYLYLLKALRDELAAVQEGDRQEYRQHLLAQADALLAVPGSIISGVLLDTSGFVTQDMQVILNSRQQVADLIIAIQAEVVPEPATLGVLGLVGICLHIGSRRPRY